MECSVCYSDDGPFQKLCCGHTFCKGCIKNWYLKGVNGAACPMCRAPIYWPGFHKVRDQWSEDAYEARCAEVFGEALDEAFAEAQEFVADLGPEFSQRIFMTVIEEFKDIERTYRFLRYQDVHPDEMADVFYYGDYYSDRHMDRGIWYNDPVHVPPPKKVTDARRGGKRSRALADEWFEMTIYIQV